MIESVFVNIFTVRRLFHWLALTITCICEHQVAWLLLGLVCSLHTQAHIRWKIFTKMNYTSDDNYYLILQSFLCFYFQVDVSKSNDKALTYLGYFMLSLSILCLIAMIILFMITGYVFFKPHLFNEVGWVGSGHTNWIFFYTSLCLATFWGYRSISVCVW